MKEFPRRSVKRGAFAGRNALVHSDDVRMWYLAATVGLAPVVGYVVTRTVALPVDYGDVGNWSEPLALVAVFVEIAVLGLCAYRLLALPRNVLVD